MTQTLAIDPGTDAGTALYPALFNHDDRLRSDLKLAMAVQREMLPRDTKRLSTARYAGWSVAAGWLGGDYYDFLDLGRYSLGLVLADVSGKGVAAALLMANLQAAVRCECAREFASVSAMLERVNAHFFASTMPSQYATMFFGRYDDQTGYLTYVNCGQQPVMVVRADGSGERLESTALPLGITEDWTGEERTIQLRKGDAVFMCSDGVVEAGLDEGCEFSEAGLTSLLTSSPERDIDFEVARIAQAARVHAFNGPADDMTVVGMRVG